MIKQKWQILLTFILLITITSLVGCGSEKMNTSGTLSVADITATDLGNGVYNIETSATFSPASGSVQAGTPISYDATFSGATTVTRSGTVNSDSTGKVVIGPWQINQDSVPVIITIKVTFEGLSTTKTLSLPAFTPLTLTPTALSFISTDIAGTSLTIGVTGGFSPYYVSSAASSDIGATISGSTITVSKLTASGDSNVSTNLTVTDSKGNQQNVVVGYYK